MSTENLHKLHNLRLEIRELEDNILEEAEEIFESQMPDDMTKLKSFIDKSDIYMETHKTMHKFVEKNHKISQQDIKYFIHRHCDPRFKILFEIIKRQQSKLDELLKDKLKNDSETSTDFGGVDLTNNIYERGRGY